MSAEEQTELVARYIMANVPGEPSRDEGAGECAVRLMRKYRAAFSRIMAEISVPHTSHTTAEANVYNIAKWALEEAD